MALVETEVCLQANCPFVCKSDGEYPEDNLTKGLCLLAYVKREKKPRVCVSNVDMKVLRKK